MLNKEQILSILEKYNLPKNEYIVLSGASLVLQDIKKETSDIDITVTQNLYNYLLKNYKCELEKTLDSGIDVWYIDNTLNFSTNYINVENFNFLGYNIQTPESILKLKKDLNRNKDKKDIEILENYLYK